MEGLATAITTAATTSPGDAAMPPSGSPCHATPTPPVRTATFPRNKGNATPAPAPGRDAGATSTAAAPPTLEHAAIPGLLAPLATAAPSTRRQEDAPTILPPPTRALPLQTAPLPPHLGIAAA